MLVTESTHWIAALLNSVIKQAGRSVFLNDLVRGAQYGVFTPIIGDAACAVACAITFQKHVYGAIAVLSDRFDILPETHGKLLEVVAAQVGEIFAQRKKCLIFGCDGRFEARWDHTLEPRS